jgi:hypothetical protein
MFCDAMLMAFYVNVPITFHCVTFPCQQRTSEENANVQGSLAFPTITNNGSTDIVEAVDNQPRVNLLQLRQNARTRERNKTEAKQRKKDLGKPSGTGSGASTSKVSSEYSVSDCFSYRRHLQSCEAY